MGQISLLVSIVLLVSGTFATLKSPVKQDNPKEYPEFHSNGEGQRNVSDLIQRDQDGQSVKRKVPGAGDVIAGVQLTVDVLKTIVKSISDVKRKVAIGIENKTGYHWKALNVYFRSGTSDATLPFSVPSGKALLYEARKTDGPVAKGAVGVLTYYIPKLSKTLAVMFSVPFDYNLYDNWWNVKLYREKKLASQEVYEDLYYADKPPPFKGDNGWHRRSLGTMLRIRGSMASSGQAILELHVKKESL